MNVRRHTLPFVAFLLSAILLVASTLASAAAPASIPIPRVSSPPRLEDFEDMAPRGNSTQLAKVTDFIQQQPSDGKPATQRTDVYLGCDGANLYAIWVCWDTNPHAIRAHLTRREAVTPPDDDYIELTLDTFHDRRHGFLFDVNPRGVQADALWSEDSGSDYSYDTVWDSSSKLTAKGYVVWMSRRFSYELMYQDITPNFHTDAGFVPRTDIRNAAEYVHFYWRPEGKHLVFQGPELNTHDIWDHNGVGLTHAYNFDWVFGFRRNVFFAPIVATETDVLRPNDFSGLPDDHQYVQDGGGLVVGGSPTRLITWRTTIIRDGTVLIVVPNGQKPITGDETFINHTMSVKPTRHLEIDNT